MCKGAHTRTLPRPQPQELPPPPLHSHKSCHRLPCNPQLQSGARGAQKHLPSMEAFSRQALADSAACLGLSPCPKQLRKSCQAPALLNMSCSGMGNAVEQTATTSQPCLQHQNRLLRQGCAARGSGLPEGEVNGQPPPHPTPRCW